MDHRDFTSKGFIDNVTLIRMISGKQAKDYIRQYATDMMSPGAIVELFNDYFPNSYFDKLCWSYYVHFEYKAYYIRLMLSAVMPSVSEYSTGSLFKPNLYNFENSIRSEFDHCVIKRGMCNKHVIQLTMEIGNRFPIQVVDNRRKPNLLERLFNV